MKKGKLIIIEGTDCSGKETQVKLLVDRLKNDNYKVERLYFPMYDTPTGKIVGGSYLGKKHICDGFFPEGAVNVDPKVASLYYAADRKYNINKIKSLLDDNYIVIVDRYVESNMGHQGGKISNKKDRLAMYKWIDKLEYEMLELPRPDLVIFLYMPYQYALQLNKNRIEESDQHERSKEHLQNAEMAYLELASIYNFTFVNCVNENKIRSINDINEQCYNIIKDYNISMNNFDKITKKC